MSVKSVVTAFTGFLSKHVADLGAVHSALSELVGVAPIDSQDKERINEGLKTVHKSIENINAFLEGNKVTGGEVTLKESDIVHALADFFNSDLGKEVLSNAVKSSEGNGNV